MKEANKLIGKLVTIEFSRDINNADIAIIGAVEDGKKVVNFYKVDRKQYTPKLKVKEVSKNKADLIELQEKCNLIGKLVFNHNESIESLIAILVEMYKLQLAESEDKQ